MNPTLRVAGAILGTFGAGLLGSQFMTPASMAWYDSLIKPVGTPPDWLFAPIWLSLYTLMAITLVLVWVWDKQTPETESWARFYFVMLLINVAWTMFFFYFHVIFLSLLTIGILIFTIVGLMIGSWEFDKRATILFAPYLAWVIYAGFLNAQLWLLN